MDYVISCLALFFGMSHFVVAIVVAMILFLLGGALGGKGQSVRLTTANTTHWVFTRDINKPVKCLISSSPTQDQKRKNYIDNPTNHAVKLGKFFLFSI